MGARGRPENRKIQKSKGAKTKLKQQQQQQSHFILNAWCISISLELELNLIFDLSAKQREVLFEEQQTLGQSYWSRHERCVSESP